MFNENDVIVVEGNIQGGPLVLVELISHKLGHNLLFWGLVWLQGGCSVLQCEEIISSLMEALTIRGEEHIFVRCN